MRWLSLDEAEACAEFAVAVADVPDRPESRGRPVAMRRPVAAVGSAVFFLAGPGTITGLVPWLLTGWQVLAPVPYWGVARMVGTLLALTGLAVLAHAFVRFVTEGSGTPVPVAAPDRLVVGGLYRYVRNPMYVALPALITGQGLVLGQPGLLIYAAVLWVFSAAFVRLREEPLLVRRFGSEYETYRRHVPAWLPRLRPWDPGSGGSGS